MLDLKAIEAGIKMISAEKGIDEAKIKEIIESALKTAYKKDYSQYKDEVVNVNLNFDTYEIDIEVEKTVVKEVENPALEISFWRIRRWCWRFWRMRYYWIRCYWWSNERLRWKFW